MKTKRSLITTQQAALVLDVTQGRVRQLVLQGPRGEPPKLWSTHMGAKLLVLDEDEVKKYRDEMAKRRVAGTVRGQPPGGYKTDKPGKTSKKRGKF